jgi:hypothetical protein
LHEVLGGVTTAMLSLMRFRRGSPDLISQAVPTEILRDASTVLSTRPFVGTWVAAPATRTLTPLCCLNLGSVDAPIYYSGGLLPGTADKRTAVAVPSNFAPAGFWGQRRLTAKEILFAKDVSEDLANILVAKGLSETFLVSFPPLGTLRVGIGLLLASREGNGGGKGNVFGRFGRRRLTGDVNSSGEGPSGLVPDEGQTNEDQTGEGPIRTVEGPTGFDPTGEGLEGPTEFVTTVEGGSTDMTREGVEGPTGYFTTVEGPTDMTGEGVKGPTGFVMTVEGLTGIGQTGEGPTGFDMTGEGVKGPTGFVTTVEGPSGFITTGEEEGEGLTEPDTLTSTEPATQAATEFDTLDSKTFEGKKKIKQDCCWEEATCSTSSLTQDPITIGDAGDLDFGIGFEDPEFDSRHEGVFNEVDKILRERKAMKSDDAAVPEYLWLEYLVEDGPSEWSAKQQGGLPAAMDLLPGRMLCWWKTCLTWSFWKWMKKIHPVVKQLTSRPRDTGVVWDAAVGRYRWKRLGLREYCRW